MLADWWFWFLIAGVLVSFGLPVLAVGVVLRLVEWSWHKRPGHFRSRRYLIAGGLLCLPYLVFIGPALVDWVLHH